MRTSKLLWMTALALIVTGCHSVTPKRHKQQAQENWSDVRAGIKCRLAQQHLEAGRFEEAITAAEEVRALDPRKEQPYEILVKANLELSRPATAMKAIDAAAELGPMSPSLIYLEGVILEQRGDIEAALTRYATARRLDPGQVDFLTAEVECLVSLDRATEALTVIDQNADRFDESATVAALGGHVAALLGDTDDAVRRYRRALAAAPESRTVRRALGLTLAADGRCAEGIDVLTPLLDPISGAAEAEGMPGAAGESQAAVLRSLARCYLELGEPATARDILSNYAVRNRDDLVAQVLLAKAALSTGDLFTAAGATQQAWRADPGDVEVLLLRAAVLWQQGRLDEARNALDLLLARAPADHDARRLLAAVKRDAAGLP